MARLDEIPVHSEEQTLTGAAPAVLREVAVLLEKLAVNGETGAIDLRGLPLSPGDRGWLQERLGKGEVEIALALVGDSTIRETAFPGVWWVVHRNERGAVESEFIEVARIPELVLAHPDDIEIGLENLKSAISELS